MSIDGGHLCCYDSELCASLLYPQPKKCYISLWFYLRVYNTFILILILITQSTNRLKLPKTQTLRISIFHLSQFVFWTRNDNWTNSLIAMQVLFVRHIILEADLGSVKLVVVITNVFFNKQQQKVEIEWFIFVKYIKSRFSCNSWNQCFHSACKTWRSAFIEN